MLYTMPVALSMERSMRGAEVAACMQGTMFTSTLFQACSDSWHALLVT